MPKSHPEALAENAILRSELYKARERARVMALIAQRANNALEALVAHMTTHETQEPPASPNAEGPTTATREGPSS